jgi:signal transduction histidine kinase
MGGDITVTSEWGKGTTTTVTLNKHGSFVDHFLHV